MEKKPGVIFVLGGPGAGKGTQCSYIVDKYKLVHLSAGELLREEMSKGNERGKMIDKCIKEGSIVKSEVTVGLLEDAMKRNGWESNSFLIDGFPRNQENLQFWISTMNEKIDFKFVLFIECNFEKLQERILERAKNSGRTDDNIESLKKRFDTFTNSTMDIVKYFEKQNKVKKIDGSKSVEEVHKLVDELFKDL